MSQPVANLEALQDMLRRVESATGADRYVDCGLACALDGFFPALKDWPERDGAMTWRVDFCRRDADGGLVSPGHGGDQMVRPYTTSLDAALALLERVLPGCNCSAVKLSPDPCEGYVWERGRVDNIRGVAATPTLALLAALLRALIAQAEESGLATGSGTAERQPEPREASQSNDPNPLIPQQEGR